MGCNGQLCMYVNITTNTSIKNDKQVNKNITTNTTKINVNKIHKQHYKNKCKQNTQTTLQ